MGTTAEKLTYLNGTKTKLKDMLNLGGASLTTEPFRQYVDTLKNRYLYFMNNGTQEVWDNWEKVVGEGTTITLNNTEEAPMKIVLKGNTSQETTTGKNKLGYTLAKLKTYNTVGTWNNNVYSYNNLTFTVNDDMSVTVNGTANANTAFNLMGGTNVFTDLNIENGNYILSGSTGGNQDMSTWCVYLGIKHSDNTTVTIFSYNGDITFNKTSGDTFFPLIRIGSGTALNNINFYPMIRVSTATSEYEEPTGGTISPCPDYPQDIHVVSGDNSIEVGNNVFDISTITPNSFIDNNGNIYASSASNLSDYIEVKENNIILSYDYTSLVSTSTRAYCWFDSNKNFISGHLYSPVNKTNIFSVVSGAKYIRFTYDKNINNIKVSNQSASYPINLGDIELCKIGDYQDSIVKDSGKWYLNKQIGKVVYTGASGENWQSGQYGTNSYYIALGNRKVPTDTTPNYNFTNLFRGVPYSARTTAGENIIFSDLTLGLYIRNTSITSVANLKTMLGTTNLISYYVLSTPTTTEITDSTLLSQLEALDKARSYNEQTNISQNNDDLPFIINATALKEMA